MKRRAFLKRAGLAVSAAALAFPRSQVLGANNRVRLGVIGIGSTVKIGGKGRQDIKDFRKIPGVQVASVCDCDADHLRFETEQFRKWGESVAAVRDFRRMLDDPEIDAVSITTPNHWHSVMAIMACQAGKDVFVQKPMSHNVWEGRQVVKAASRYQRVVQATHGPRGNGAIEPALAWVRAGNLGKIRVIQGLNYKPRMSIGRVKGAQPIPEGCDYDLWCGPALKKPLHREFLHYDWHWDWDTGNGDLGNMGIHFMDGCRWAAGQTTLPSRVLTVGGRLGYKDDGETPNTLVTLLDYQPVPIIFEVRGLPKHARYQTSDWPRNPRESMDHHHGMRLGVIVHCEGGSVRFGSGNGCTAFDAKGKKIREFHGDRVSTKQNFIDCVRDRRSDRLHSSAIEGHLSCGLVNLTNISYRVGVESNDANLRDERPVNAAFGDALDRMRQHLDANAVDLKATPLEFGRMLTFDPTEERFSGPHAAKANALVSGRYRAPFVIPHIA